MRFLLLLLMLSSPVMAVEPSEMLADPVLEARAREISKGLRCLVCLNENIDDSNAGLASDIRILLRERLTAGDTDAEAVQYLVDRYGEFVLLKPRFSASNMVLWLAGPGLLLIGGIGAWVFIRRRSGAMADEELSDEEQEKLASLLQE
jgi:cytochrome c-type biogenesis protein CcmH